MKGKFITFEGCEGSGKSTQMRFLSEYLTEMGIDHIITREPGGNKISEAIRTIILDKDNGEMFSETEALLYAAARVQHIKGKVMPALNEGKIVLCDRYIDSSLAYQSYARGLGDYVETVNGYAIKNCMPDVTLFFDITPEQAFLRKHGVDKNDRIELEGLDFHNKVYEGYLDLARRYPERILRVDCSRDKLTTRALIKRLLIERNIIG